MLREVLTVSALILAVLLVRAIFKNRVPKRMVYALWLVVLVKLCLPGTLVSLPILPAEETAAPVQRVELPAQTAPVVLQPAQAVVQPQVSAQQPVSPAQEATEPAAKPLTTIQILQIVWAVGSALLGLWLLGTWLVFAIRLHKSRRFLSKRGGTRIYVSSAVKSPCLAGLVPAVYLTEDVLQTNSTELILRHELTHLRHLDFLWSLCRTAAVIVYWWNPFIWLAAICSKRDAELACDEAVAAGLSDAQRLAYARTILAQAPRRAAALSLAGPPVRERILFLTKKQKTSVLCVILALLLVVSATGCSFAELTRQKSGEITLPKKTQTVQVETTTNITPQADAWREANLPTEYDLLGCCDFVDWFILLTGSKAPGSSENTGYTAFQAFVVQKDGEDYTLAAWNDTSEWDSSVGFMVHTLVTNDRTVIYGFTTDTVFGVWDQENRHDVSFDEITVTFQDSSIPLTRSIDPGKPFLTFSEGTRSIADISFSDGERTANWSDVSGDGLNEPSEPLDCAPLLSKKSSCTTSLPTPASSMFGLTGREAVLFDAAVAQRYPRDDNDIVLPSLREYGSFEENGKTVVICDLHYDFYYDYTGPDWEWNGGAMNTYLRAELETQDGAEVCTGFEIFPGGSPSDWISGECGPLAMQNADGAWVLPEAAGDWFPAVENPFQQYLEVIASTAASSGESAEAVLQDDTIWSRVHEKLDYAHWAQDMTAEYEDIVRKFQIEDSKMSDLPGDVSQWPRYYSAFVEYFSGANADLRYLDADTIWTKDLSEDRQSLIVTMTRADVVLTLSYSLQTSQITEVSTRRNAILQSVTDSSVTAEHIALLNASLEEDLQTLKALNIPPQNYYYGYYRVDSGEIFTYKVDPNASVTIYDIEQEYGAGEDRLYTFKTWRDFVAAAQENEGLLVQPYTLTLKNGVVVKIEEKFYN